jgi:hypothetical protein
MKGKYIMSKLDFINEFGGLINTTKTYKKEPMTIETMLKEGIKTQRERPFGGEGSWFKDNKVTPKVGVYKLFDNEDSNCGFLITEDQKDYYLNRLEEEFNNGSFVEELEEIRIKHQQMLDKRETNKKSKS